MPVTPVVLAATEHATDQAPLVVLTVAAVLAVLAAATGFTLWRYAERDMVDARADADRWEQQHRDTTARLVQAEVEVKALRWQLGQWLDLDVVPEGPRPDTLPVIVQQEAQVTWSPTPRLWTGGVPTSLAEVVAPAPVEVALVPAVVEPEPVEDEVGPVGEATADRWPGGLSAGEAAAAARWHRQGRTWAQVGDLLGVSGSVASGAARRADPDC